MHDMTRQLQSDREAEAYFQQTHAEHDAYLRNTVKANNWQQLPLEKSPCVRVKKTGKILGWTEALAERPDLCECCNEDGSPWVPTRQQPVVEPPKMNVTIERKPVGDEHTSPVGMASELLGVAENFSRDFTEPTTRKEALPLPKQETAVAVDELVQAVFKDQMG